MEMGWETALTPMLSTKRNQKGFGGSYTEGDDEDTIMKITLVLLLLLTSLTGESFHMCKIVLNNSNVATMNLHVQKLMKTENGMMVTRTIGMMMINFDDNVATIIIQ